MTEKKVLHNIKAAMFDLDGTLFDSVGVWMDIDDKFLAARGHKPTPEYKRGIAALSNIECAKFTIDFYGLDDTPERLVAEWYDMARNEYAHNVKLMPFAGEYVRQAHSRGIKLFAVTSLSDELAALGLKNNGIADRFSGLISAGATGLSKSKPEIYKYAAELAGERPSACVMFDDIARATLAAREAGFISVAVRNEKSYDDGMAIDGCADFCVSSFAEAPILLND